MPINLSGNNPYAPNSYNRLYTLNSYGKVSPHYDVLIVVSKIEMVYSVSPGFHRRSGYISLCFTFGPSEKMDF